LHSLRELLTNENIVGTKIKKFLLENACFEIIIAGLKDFTECQVFCNELEHIISFWRRGKKKEKGKGKLDEVKEGSEKQKCDRIAAQNAWLAYKNYKKAHGLIAW